MIIDPTDSWKRRFQWWRRWEVPSGAKKDIFRGNAIIFWGENSFAFKKFFNCLLLNPDITRNPVFEGFLRCQDEKEWAAIKKEADRAEAPKNIDQQLRATSTVTFFIENQGIKPFRFFWISLTKLALWWAPSTPSTTIWDQFTKNLKALLSNMNRTPKEWQRRFSPLEIYTKSLLKGQRCLIKFLPLRMYIQKQLSTFIKFTF